MKHLITSILIISTLQISAQSGMVSFGGDFTGAGGSFSFSGGLTDYSSVYSDAGSIQFGLQHAYDGSCTPGWEPVPNLQYNMQLVAQIFIDDAVSMNPDDVLGAFVGEECRGIASPLPEVDGLVFLTIGSNVSDGEQVELRIWNSTLCESCDAGPGFDFENQAEIGTFLEPYAVSCITDVELDLSFGQGYTWFSVNVDPGSMGLNDLFTELEPCYDDRVIGQTSFALYTGSMWAGTLNQLALDRMYRMRLCSQQSITLTGEPAPLEPVELNAGYTWLGYVPQECMPINEALANMEPAPSYDDRMIGQNSFALYTGTQWIGTLSTLCPGEGYVIRLANPVTLNWPEDDNGEEFNCGTSTVTFTYKGEDVTYGTVVGANNKCWLDRNLGATQVATSSDDANSYGDLFQWGRGDDGHQNRTSGTTPTRSNSDTPGHGNFITVGSSPYDWRSPQNNNLWQGVSGTNNPCPAGYRLPTEAEWEAERQSWSSNNAAGAFNSPLKLPVAGYRGGSDGSLGSVGSRGYYWSATVVGFLARGLFFHSGNAFVDNGYRAYGRSVRCLKD